MTCIDMESRIDAFENKLEYGDNEKKSNATNVIFKHFHKKVSTYTQRENIQILKLESIL
jgi:hypothetical protein